MQTFFHEQADKFFAQSDDTSCRSLANFCKKLMTNKTKAFPMIFHLLDIWQFGYPTEHWRLCVLTLSQKRFLWWFWVLVIKWCMWFKANPNSGLDHPGGSVVSMSDLWPGGCEFDTQLRRTFLLACVSPLTSEACEKSGLCSWET